MTDNKSFLTFKLHTIFKIHTVVIAEEPILNYHCPLVVKQYIFVLPPIDQTILQTKQQN